MKSIVAFCLLAVVAVTVADTIKYIPVLERTETHDDRGQFALRYLTGDGTAVGESGALIKTNDGLDYVLAKKGYFQFIGTDGITYRTEYTADKDGFRATGDHLPKSVVA